MSSYLVSLSKNNEAITNITYSLIISCDHKIMSPLGHIVHKLFPPSRPLYGPCALIGDSNEPEGIKRQLYKLFPPPLQTDVPWYSPSITPKITEYVRSRGVSFTWSVWTEDMGRGGWGSKEWYDTDFIKFDVTYKCPGVQGLATQIFTQGLDSPRISNDCCCSQWCKCRKITMGISPNVIQIFSHLESSLFAAAVGFLL